MASNNKGSKHMTTFFHKIIAACMLLTLAACATGPAEAPQDLSDFKASKPRSILILPPQNDSVDTTAPGIVISTLTYPLAEAGYYVLPVALVDATLKQNGISSYAEAQQISAGKLREIFGADAALQISIKKFGATYEIVDSVTQVTLEATLIDLRTKKTLFKKTASASNKSSNQSNDFVAMLISAALKQIVNSLNNENYEISTYAANRLFSTGTSGDLLYGPYSPKYGTD
jgi:hypothetical protein